MYRRKFAIDAGQAKPADTDWTGAEIKACCRLSRLLGVSLAEAARNVEPVAVTAAESVAKLPERNSLHKLSPPSGAFLNLSTRPAPTLGSIR